MKRTGALVLDCCTDLVDKRAVKTSMQTSAVKISRKIVGKCRWRSKMSHANFKGGFWNFKIWIKRRVLLPILCQMTF